MEFIIKEDSFQYLGSEEDLELWNKNKYRAWYEMPWSNPKAKDSKTSSEKLFACLSYFFHESLSSTKDIKLLREKVKVQYDFDDLFSEVLQADLAIYRRRLRKDWLDLQFTSLLDCFRQDISSYEGSVTEYYNDKGLKFNLPDRIIFHLVENKGKNTKYPFAFMA